MCMKTLSDPAVEASLEANACILRYFEFLPHLILPVRAAKGFLRSICSPAACRQSAWACFKLYLHQMNATGVLQRDRASQAALGGTDIRTRADEQHQGTNLTKERSLHCLHRRMLR